MNIRVSQEQGRVPVTVFRLDGRVNLGNADELERMAQQAHADGMRDLIIDLEEVTSLTSAGMRVLHSIYRLLGVDASERSTHIQKSRHLKLVNPSPYVRRVLEIAGYDLFLDIYGDLQEAVASF
jgi:anti-anti-sigma factor